MKKIILLAAILLATSAGFSQAIIDTLSNTLCTCLTDKKLELDASGEKMDFKNELGMCMISIFADKIGQLQAAYKDSFELSENFGEKIGVEIAKKAITNCPAFMEMAIQAGKENMENEELGGDKAAQTFSVSGVLKEVKAGSLLTFKVKGDNGKEVSLLVMHNGEGISEFLSQYSTLINKKITVHYAISEIYNPVTKEFELKKEVTKIELP